MTQTLYVFAALCVGMGSAVQVAFISQISRLRDATGATWINTLGALVGVCLGIIYDILQSHPPNLPSPFSHALTYVGVMILAGICLAIAMRGLSPYLAISGLFGFIYVFGAGFLAPKIGIALFAATVTAGTLAGSVVLDHFGTFGVDVHRATAMRLIGLVMLFAGVVMVRAGR